MTRLRKLHRINGGKLHIWNYFRVTFHPRESTTINRTEYYLLCSHKGIFSGLVDLISAFWSHQITTLRSLRRRFSVKNVLQRTWIRFK